MSEENPASEPKRPEDHAPPALNAVEIRVLGTLMEKARLTPEYYPMTLNGLTLATNQKTSREPVTDYDESTVSSALTSLREKGLALRIDSAGSRVPKYRHLVRDRWALTAPEEALLAVLMLRGAQTLGQLRQRTERLYGFDTLEEAHDTLRGLAAQNREPFALAQGLARRGGAKEVRFTHAWAELKEEDSGYEVSAPVQPAASPLTEKITELTAKVESLEKELAELREEFRCFKASFE